MGRHDTNPPVLLRPGTAHGAVLPQPNVDQREALPKLRELRDDVFFWAEYNYLRSLVSLCGHNVQKACQVSGLSRSRLYSLLKKYQLTTPLHTPCHQK